VAVSMLRNLGQEVVVGVGIVVGQARHSVIQRTRWGSLDRGLSAALGVVKTEASRVHFGEACNKGREGDRRWAEDFGSEIERTVVDRLADGWAGS
jgi:hypothetical protein